MSTWKAKRFWKAADVAESGTGFTVYLDGRPVKTPAKRDLVLPSRALAQAVAAEWDAQDDEVRPQTMPIMRASNAAIDKVAQQHAEVAGLIAAYGDSDLLCFRAESPDELIRRQADTWDPLLDWAEARFGAKLIPTTGIMPNPQGADALETLSRQVHGMDAFTLTAFHDLVGLSGSLVIGLAALHGQDEIGDLWRASRVDEIWQEEQWGVDEEAREMAAAKEQEFRAAKTFYNLIHDDL